MPSALHLPVFVRDCTATAMLIVRSLVVGELPTASYDDAWDALEALQPGGYRPAREVEDWMREHWREIWLVGNPSGMSGAEIVPEPVKLGVTEGEVSPYFPPSRAQSRSWMPKFLAIFVSSGGSTTAAAQAVNISRRTPSKAAEVDEAFRAAWDEAKAHIADAVRTVLYDRAVNGWQEPVYGSLGNYTDGLIGTITKCDNSLLKYLAQARCEEFKQAAKDGAPNISVNASANAQAVAVAPIPPEKVADLQARRKRQLEKAAKRLGVGTN